MDERIQNVTPASQKYCIYSVAIIGHAASMLCNARDYANDATPACRRLNWFVSLAFLSISDRSSLFLKKTIDDDNYLAFTVKLYNFWCSYCVVTGCTVAHKTVKKHNNNNNNSVYLFIINFVGGGVYVLGFLPGCRENFVGGKLEYLFLLSQNEKKNLCFI